ncbi:conjugal transfer protein TraL [Rodentibacter sp. JRC1]|uniref:type IV conjugative transfer system protein TraL n=1 Tax=Rodentibacter sp. JRC1 TaxID=2874504 RepID=UPI001CFDBF3D|nr:type IV conjugative transfer system protein TraL [Rodentibacter sp. JRC1]GJI56953.1 conjugal transfer protein TraL [Rodentibacter sp. JRC1]
MNDNSRKRYQFPATLSNQGRLFGLTIDEAVILIPQSLLMVFYNPYVFAITLLISFFTIRHLKKGKGSSYLLCLMYWFLPKSVTASFITALPSSHIRYWIS